MCKAPFRKRGSRSIGSGGVLACLALPDGFPLPTDEQTDPISLPIDEPQPEVDFEAIAARVQAQVQAETGLTTGAIGQYSRETWTDSCLGLGGPAESCLMALTDGWQVEVIDTSEQRYVYRTDLTGQSIRREP